MFCSKCGKTLPFDANTCPSCGEAVGESRFEGSPYTSAQAHIRPGDDVHQVVTQNYTRTNYTGDPDSAEQADVDARTTYRPAYGGDSMPEEMRRDISAVVHPEEEAPADAPAEDAPAEEPIAFDPDNLPEDGIISYGEDIDGLTLEDLDLSKFRAKPIESTGQSGISADVSEMMQKMEFEPPRRVRGFGRRRQVYDDYQDTVDYVDQDTDMAAAPEYDEQAEVFDDIDEEEFNELRHSTFGLKQILKIVVAVIVVAALIVGGVMWMNYIRDRQSAAPIENVRETLYADGVSLIKNHASTENVESVLTDYAASNSDLAALQAKLTASSAAVDALLPADATENEQIFLNALKKIEGNITNCIISDAIAVGSNDASAVAESDNRWQVVNNSIGMLEVATSTVELTAIINGEVVDVKELAKATPTPEPAVNYNTLSKGDKSDDVLFLQQRLFDLGYLNDNRDGNFGGKTQTAVKIFQQIAGLPVTGIADSATQNALYADNAPRADAGTTAATPSPTNALALTTN